MPYTESAMERQVYADSTDPQLAIAHRERNLQLWTLATICLCLLALDILLLVQEFLWRRSAEGFLPGYAIAGFLAAAFIPQVLATRKPSKAAVLHFRQLGSLPKSKMITH